MRVLVVDTYYPPFLADHYAERRGLAEAAYAEQHRALMERRFGTSDAYSHNLRLLGHEASELVVNCPPLQAAWAREHGRRVASSVLAAPGPTRRLALLWIAAAQVRALKPDVLYIQDLWFFPRWLLDGLRRQVRLVVGQIASPPPADRVLRSYDLITTSFPHFVERFRRLGIDTEYLRIGFDERVLDELSDSGTEARPEAERPIAVAFVGGLNPKVHGPGTHLLERALDVTDIEAWGYGAEALPESSALRRRHHGHLWALDMYRVLARSRIVLNRHIEAAEGHANNMRLYEATGAGAMLLTDDGDNLGDLFEPGREVVVYEDENDLVERIRYYTSHEQERRAIAAAGQARTLRDHTYRQRVVEVAALLQARI